MCCSNCHSEGTSVLLAISTTIVIVLPEKDGNLKK